MAENSSLQKDLFFMRQALALAKEAEIAGEVPVGALAIVDNVVIGEGYNTSIADCDPTAHAEIMALRSAAQKLNNYRLPELDIYVTLEPCLMCVGAMIQARIRRLIFGAYDPKSGAIASVFALADTKKLNHNFEFCGGVLADECGKILSDFFKSRR